MYEQKIKVLFVCLGNICRSPSAEAVFRTLVDKAGYTDAFEIDSAGLIGVHQGERADGRMRQHAERRGYSLESRSRPITYNDFDHYDYIIGMDESNRQGLIERAPTQEAREKISLLTEWHPKPLLDHVPDPYYGGAEGFEQVLDLVESCSEHLLSSLVERHHLGSRAEDLSDERIQQAIDRFVERNGLTQFSPKAIFFDMDGVLFDTMTAHARSWCEAAHHFGLEMTTEDVYMFEGQTKQYTINLLTQRSWGRPALESEVEEIYAHKTRLFVSYDSGMVIPQVSEVLERVRAIKPVLVTGSSQPTLLQRVEKAFPNTFGADRVISGLDVRHGKPNPEPYLMASERAQVKPTEGIVIENAPMGVRAGHEANCFVLAVNTGPLADEILYQEGADLVLRDMRDLLRVVDYLENKFNFVLNS